MRHVFAFVILFTTHSASILSAQSTVPLDKLLTPDQYRAAGLTKLSKSELDSLSRYVTDYSQSVARVVLEAAISSPRNRSGDVPGPSTSPASAGIVGRRSRAGSMVSSRAGTVKRSFAFRTDRSGSRLRTHTPITMPTLPEFSFIDHPASIK